MNGGESQVTSGKPQSERRKSADRKTEKTTKKIRNEDENEGWSSKGQSAQAHKKKRGPKLTKGDFAGQKKISMHRNRGFK